MRIKIFLHSSRALPNLLILSINQSINQEVNQCCVSKPEEDCARLLSFFKISIFSSRKSLSFFSSRFFSSLRSSVVVLSPNIHTMEGSKRKMKYHPGGRLADRYSTALSLRSTSSSCDSTSSTSVEGQ